MEERKTAAIVLSILALVIIFFTVILPEIKFRGTQTLSFKGCAIHFTYYSHATSADEDVIAQNKLGLCLCSLYDKKHDTAVAKKILYLYYKSGSSTTHDSLKHIGNNKIDSILKYRNKAFNDTVIMLD